MSQRSSAAGLAACALLWAAASGASAEPQFGTDHQFERTRVVVGVVPPTWARGLIERTAGDAVTNEGFGPRVVREALARVGLEAEFVPLGGTALDTALNERVVDAVVAVSVTSDHLTEADFTIPLMVARGAVYSRPGAARLETAEGLRSAGKPVAVAAEGASELWCVENQVPYARCSTLRAAFERVASGESDHLVTLIPTGRVEIERFGFTGFKETPLRGERLWRAFAVAVQRGNASLRADLNNGLAMLIDSGRFDVLYDRTAGKYQPREKRPGVPESWLWATAAAAAMAVAGISIAYGLLQRRLRVKREALLTAQRELKLLYAEIPALVYTYYVGADGERRLVSMAEGVTDWERRFPGLKIGQPWETTIGPRMHPEDVGPYRAVVERSRSVGGTFAAEFRLRDADGQFRWLHSRAVPTPTQGGVIWCSILIDVTDVREMRAQLERTGALYRELFEATPDAILLFRDQGRVIVEANSAALDLYGYTREQLLGMSLEQVSAEWEANQPFLAEVAREGYVEFSTLHRRSDGARLDVDIRGTLVEIGGETLVLSINRDATAKRRADELRRRLESELAAARQMEALGVMAGGIAHDFNNVLVGILGNASLAKLQVDAKPELTASLSRIEEAGHFAADLVRQLLEYGGRRPLKREPVELSTLMREVVSTLGARIRPRVTLAGPEAWALGDATSIKQAIMNLMTNAADAIGAGSGEITLRCGVRRLDASTEDHCVSGRDAPTGEYAFVCVEDSGPGMDAAIRARLFEPFVSSKGPGRGIGLALVRASAARLNGAITLRSERGVGTLFEILYPVAPAEKAAPRARTEPRSDEVLVIDDDPGVRATLRELVRSAGYRVREAASGEEGLAAAAKSTPDAVVLDINMPGMDGWTVLEHLRADHPSVAVVISSGRTTKAGNGGVTADAVLPKPYTLAQMADAIQDAIRTRRAQFSDAPAMAAARRAAV